MSRNFWIDFCVCWVAYPFSVMSCIMSVLTLSLSSLSRTIAYCWFIILRFMRRASSRMVLTYRRFWCRLGNILSRKNRVFQRSLSVLEV